MKKIKINAYLFAFVSLLIACSKSEASDLYFQFNVDGKEFSLKEDEISSSYNEFGNNREFKIFAGGDNGPGLVMTIVADMSGPSSTPSGSSEPGSAISQGSVSLQGYPEKGDTFNSHDGFASPEPVPSQDAIVVTESVKIGDEARIITGKINVTVSNSFTDKDRKDYLITGKFRIKHEFSGAKF